MENTTKPTEIPKNSRVCIICHEGIAEGGTPVKDDIIIRTIRNIKKRLRVAQNNTLVVCEKDLPEYQKRRKKFEKDIVVVAGISVFLFLILAGLPLLSGRFNIGAFVSGLMVSVAVLAIGVVFKHVPALENMAAAPMQAPLAKPKEVTLKNRRKKIR